MAKKRKDARIFPETIPALFAELGIKPIAGDWVDYPNKCGCLAIALIAKSHDKETALNAGREWSNKGIRFGKAASKLAAAAGLHEDYALGLIYGWDNRDTHPSPRHTDEYRRLVEAGWNDGRAAALACGLDVPPLDDSTPYVFWFV